MVKIEFKAISPANYSPAVYRAPIDKVVVHWIAGTLESAYITFSNPERAGSATYGVGPDRIYQFMGEDKVSWANSNWEWNTSSITIENEGGPNMPFNNDVFSNLAWLVAKIAKEHGLGMLVVGKNLFQHKDAPGASTSCAGYYGDRLGELATLSNKILGEVPAGVKPVTNDKTKGMLGKNVTFTHLWTQSVGGNRLPALITSGKITHVIPGASHPYLINGGAGWLSDSDVNKTAKNSVAKTKPQIGDTVRFNYLWTQSMGGVRLKALVNTGVITNVIPGAKQPYLIGNGTGWLSEKDIIGAQSSAKPAPKPAAKPATFKVGDKVQFTKPVDEHGRSLYVEGTYVVLEVTNPNRIVVGRNNMTTAAVSPKNLRKV